MRLLTRRHKGLPPRTLPTSLRIPALALLGGLVAVAAPGCAGGPSKEEFIARADRICRSLAAQTQDLAEPKSRREFERNLREARTLTLDALRRLRALEAPSGDAEAIDSMLDKVEESIELLPDLQRAVERNDLEEMNRITTRVQQLGTQVAEQSRDYGFRDCGRGGFAPTE